MSTSTVPATGTSSHRNMPIAIFLLAAGVLASSIVVAYAGALMSFRHEELFTLGLKSQSFWVAPLLMWILCVVTTNYTLTPVLNFLIWAHFGVVMRYVIILVGASPNNTWLIPSAIALIIAVLTAGISSLPKYQVPDGNGPAFLIIKTIASLPLIAYLIIPFLID